MTWRDPYSNARQHRHAGMDHAGGDHAGHGGHHWMMIACCIPMIVIAVALVAAGVASPAFILVAFGCLAMMWMMMRAMGGMDQDSGPHK